MTPPAWSSLPDRGLNFTSTKPSLRLVSSFMQIGYVPSPDCFSTFGLLGAESSRSTLHLAAPVPVSVPVQWGGSLPGLALSNPTVSASTDSVNPPPAITSTIDSSIIKCDALMPDIVCVEWLNFNYEMDGARAHQADASRRHVVPSLLLWRRGWGRGGHDYLTRSVPLNLQADPSPRPSPLRKGRGGIVGRFLAIRASFERGPILFSKLRYVAAFQQVALPMYLGCGLRTTASFPWPSPPKEGMCLAARGHSCPQPLPPAHPAPRFFDRK